MTTNHDALLVTGATGLVGGAVLDRLLHADPCRDVFVLVRDEAGWRRLALSRGQLLSNVTADPSAVPTAGRKRAAPTNERCSPFAFVLYRRV